MTKNASLPGTSCEYAVWCTFSSLCGPFNDLWTKCPCKQVIYKSIKGQRSALKGAPNCKIWYGVFKRSIPLSISIFNWHMFFFLSSASRFNNYSCDTRLHFQVAYCLTWCQLINGVWVFERSILNLCQLIYSIATRFTKKSSTDLFFPTSALFFGRSRIDIVCYTSRAFISWYCETKKFSSITDSHQ